MVNEINKGSVPWQSTIPQQMPWMSSYDPNQIGLQFEANQMAAASSIPQVVGQTQVNLSTVTPFPQIPIDPSLLYQAQSEPQSGPSQNSSLITLSSYNQTKRSSLEMEDEPITIDDIEPPATKQVLTERKLFKQFGSLHLDPAPKSTHSDDSDDSDSADTETSGSEKKSIFVQGREEFQRYVYLLFKDKNHKSPVAPSYDAIERLAREEREKLSKALVLWNPRMRSFFNQDDQSDDSDSDDNVTYKDHTDFLKDKFKSENSVIITDVTDQFCNPSLPVNNQPSCTDPDDLMLD